MAGTYGDMQTRIADEIQDSILTSQIQLAIQTAISFYERTNFYFNTKVGNWTTVAGQEWYGAAALADIPNLIRIYAPMKFSLNGYLYDLNPTDNSYIESAQSGQIITWPQFFAYYQQQIRLYPIPDQNYPIRMDYQYRLPSLVNIGDTNAWMTDGEMLIRQAAKRIIAQDVTKEMDPSAGPTFMEQTALDALQAETRARLSNGILATERTGNGSAGRFNIFTGL